jgi:hypothetical protein
MQRILIACQECFYIKQTKNNIRCICALKSASILKNFAFSAALRLCEQLIRSDLRSFAGLKSAPAHISAPLREKNPLRSPHSCGKQLLFRTFTNFFLHIKNINSSRDEGKLFRRA